MATKPATTAKPKPAAAPAKKKTAPVPRLSTRDGKGGDGRTCVQNIVNNDRQTQVYLLQALYYREQARQAGRDSAPLSTALDRIVASYAERQQRLRSSRLLKTQATLNQWAKTWMDKLKSVVSGPAVGVLPVIPIAIGAVVLLGTVGLCWLAFHKDEPKSAADVLSAYHASAAYGSMSAEQQQTSDQAVQEAGKNAYQEGKDQSGGLFGNLNSTLVLLGVGLVGMKLLERKGS